MYIYNKYTYIYSYVCRTVSVYYARCLQEPYPECSVDVPNVVVYHIYISIYLSVGILPCTTPLSVCRYLVNETELVPWTVALR